MDKYLTSFDGIKIFYKHFKGNKDKTLVFLHGVGGNWTIWKKEINYFVEQGYSIIAPDLRGHGLSDVPEPIERYKLNNFSKDLMEIFKKEKIKNFALIGHSFGAGIVVTYCMNKKRRMPKQVILVEGSNVYPFDHNRLLNMNRYVTHLMRFIAAHEITKKEHFINLKDIDLTEEGIKGNIHMISYILHITPIKTMVNILDYLEEYMFKNKNKLSKTLRELTIPTIIIAGEKDQVILPEYVHLTKKEKKDAKYYLLKDCGHRAPAEKPEEVTRIIEKYII
mgnify:FL=1